VFDISALCVHGQTSRDACCQLQMNDADFGGAQILEMSVRYHSPIL